MRGSSFFAGLEQHDVVVDAGHCPMPTFGYDIGSISAIFPARLKALRAILPDRRLVPARLAPGVGLVEIFALEYRDTDVGPYNEVGVAIVLNDPSGGANLPVRALVSMQRRRQAHSFIHHLPVTTEISREVGAHFYGFPKFLAQIGFSDEGTRRVCRLEQDGQPILTLAVEQLATSPGGEWQYFMHLWMQGQPQLAEIRANNLRLGASMKPGAAALTLGDLHPVATELRGLLISTRPLYCEYVPSFEGILFAPEHLTASALERWQRAREAARAAAVA